MTAFTEGPHSPYDAISPEWTLSHLTAQYVPLHSSMWDPGINSSVEADRESRGQRYVLRVVYGGQRHDLGVV